METLKSAASSDRALDILLLKLEEAKARNANFSLRAFAARIGVSSGALSEILKGKRSLSVPIKRRIASKLLLSPQETIEFFQNDLPNKMGLQVDNRPMLSQDQFHLISDWWYYGLLNLIKTRGFKSHLSWMARRLGLGVSVVADAWDRLLRLGYIEEVRSAKGTQILRKQPNLRTSDNLMDLSIRKSHLEDLKLIESSLQSIPLELRDNTSCTFVIDKEDLPKAKEFIRVFQGQFLNQFGKDHGDEVYKMSIAVYPLTRVAREQ